MRSMSMVAHLADCPETLPEARQLIHQLDATLRSTREEVARLRASLTTIRTAGNDSAQSIWMQGIAAHALEPLRLPHPGKQPLQP